MASVRDKPDGGQKGFVECSCSQSVARSDRGKPDGSVSKHLQASSVRYVGYLRNFLDHPVGIGEFFNRRTDTFEHGAIQVGQRRAGS